MRQRTLHSLDYGAGYGVSVMQAKYKVTYHCVDRFGNPETLEENTARLAHELYQVSKSDPTFVPGILRWMKQNAG